MSAPLRVDDADGVRTVRLDRPASRNAIDWELRRALLGAFREAAVDTRTRIVVVRGDERAFCAGGDLTEMGRGPVDDLAKLTAAGEIAQTVAAMPQPVVAVVRGHAAGAGFGLALACDLVVADETARFHLPFLGRGLVPDMGLTHWLAHQLGPRRALDVCLTGRTLDADEAASLGLVARLWTSTELEERLAGLVSGLLDASPAALALTKELVRRATSDDLRTALAGERLAQTAATAARDGLGAGAAPPPRQGATP